MNRFWNWSILLMLAFFINACNDDDDIIEVKPEPPTVSFDSEDYIYKVKVGHEISISPIYRNNKDASYSWEMKNETVSTDSIFRHTFEKSGNYFVSIEVTTAAGSCNEEIKIEVAELAPPVISLVVPEKGLDVIIGKEYLLEPDVQNADSTCRFSWKVNGKEVGTKKDYTLKVEEAGTFEISLYAENEDGNATKTFQVNAVERIPLNIIFPSPMYNQYKDEVVKHVSLGRTIYLRPYITGQRSPEFQWESDGKAIEGATGQMYAFTPKTTGNYTLSLIVKDKDQTPVLERNISRNISSSDTYETKVTIKVICDPKEGTYYRKSAAAQKDKVKVYEFIAAPGQFVNDYHYKVPVNTMEAAVECAQDRIDRKDYISLGGFGGYLTVGFDHSIDNVEGQYNFSILGNQFDGSSEPGVVWVSQDVNNDGIPNDEWYELKGSEYGKSTTRQMYAVTYSRPEGSGMNVPWQDNEGQKGCVDYLKEFHKQPFYYPEWIKENSYTLYGTCLEARNYRQSKEGETEYWVNPSYGWGYVDNFGSDRIGNTQYIGFKISNAVNLDGSAADLKYVDFIKVVNGLNTKSGWIGELSTEVMGFRDENMVGAGL